MHTENAWRKLCALNTFSDFGLVSKSMQWKFCVYSIVPISQACEDASDNNKEDSFFYPPKC